MPGLRLVVDGANIVGSRPDGWWRDRAGAARRLYERLVEMAGDGEIVLVLEGQARAGVAEGDGSVQVVHAPHDGDGAIVELVAGLARPEEWTVVTADRDLRRRVEALGAAVAGPSAVLDRP